MNSSRLKYLSVQKKTQQISKKPRAHEHMHMNKSTVSVVVFDVKHLDLKV